MKTKMSVTIVVKGCIESKELYEELKKFRLNVIDMGDKTLVYALIDLRDPEVEEILSICHRYGDCDIEARLVEKGS